MKIVKPYGENGFTFHPNCCISWLEAQNKANEKLIKQIRKCQVG